MKMILFSYFCLFSKKNIGGPEPHLNIVLECIWQQQGITGIPHDNKVTLGLNLGALTCQPLTLVVVLAVKQCEQPRISLGKILETCKTLSAVSNYPELTINQLKLIKFQKMSQGFSFLDIMGQFVTADKNLQLQEIKF